MYKRLIHGGLLWWSLLALNATDGYYFMDLVADVDQETLTVSWKPQKLVDYQQFNDPQYDFDGFTGNSLDAYLQYAVILLFEANEQRKSLRVKKDKLFHITSFQFLFTLREISGKPIQRKTLDLDLFLDGGSVNQAVIGHNERRWRLPISKLIEPQGYLEFLEVINGAIGGLRFKTPQHERFMLECFYAPRELVEDLPDKIELGDLSRNAYRGLYLALNYNQQEHLGTTFCLNRDGRLPQVRSGHLHFLAQATRLYSEILEKRSAGEPFIADLEDYLEMEPTNLKAVEMLAEAYVKRSRRSKAIALVRDYAPMLGDYPQLTELKTRLLNQEHRELERLLATKNQIERDERVRLEILSPKYGDYVGGNAKLVFDMTGNSQPILRMDVVEGDQVLGSIFGPPYEIPFTPQRMRGRVFLKLITYFKNRTYQIASMAVKPLAIHDENLVNLATLRVSATQGSDYLLALDSEDFSILEQNDRREISNFRRDKAPLRVVILIDTSFSMSGQKLYRAQYAVNTFLSKLKPEDRASIFTFDQNVMRLSGFTNEFDSMQSVLLTLSPHHSTSLYDALIRAHQDLRKRDGNRVIIVVSDGRDSASANSRDSVFQLFRDSPVLVYPIALNLDNTTNREGREFMERISKMTGSALLEVANIEGLEVSFTRIYNELRSFYLMDFYSSQRDFSLGEIQVKVHKVGVQTRFSRQVRDAIWQ